MSRLDLWPYSNDYQAWLSEVFGIQSPSKVAIVFGAEVADVFRRGIKNEYNYITAQRKRRKAHVRRWRRW